MLVAGTTFGPYRIVCPLGAGGMGEVYRAHDARLGRDVAIKVLPPHLAATPEVRARFEREARTVSQLAHPHICTLFDVGHQDGTDYLVMELLEGETLAHRLEKGALPAAEALTIGVQVAEALDKAHRAGVVHRDLKPGNVMLTKGGAKLMDFGLARATGMAAAAGTLSQSPTVSHPLTAEGTIVGTFQYMAPEQLEGREADARSDLWALGCVLYEMTTGQRAFEGQSQASLIAAILKEEPRPIAELQPLSPPSLDHLVRRCLAKDPADRWQSARDVAHELRWAAEAGSQSGLPAIAGIRRRPAISGWWVAAVMTVVTIVALALPRFARRPPAPVLARFAVAAPGTATVVMDGTSAAVSPDGRSLAFLAVDSSGISRLWIRSLDSFSARPLAGTENGALPFWSPDSRFLAFFAPGKLLKIAVDGGAPTVLCDAPDGRGGSWGRSGVIVFAPQSQGPLLRVSAEGGEVTEAARADSSRHESGLRFPHFLPDGRHFLYVSLPRRQEGFDVYAASLDSKERRWILAAGGSPVYAEPGYLLFPRMGRLLAQRFDPARLRTRGEPLSLGEAPAASAFEGASLVSVSASGVLAHDAIGLPDAELVWLDRSGRLVGKLPLPPGRYDSPTLSPDGQWAAFTRPSGGAQEGYDVWVADLSRGVVSRLTFDGGAAGAGGIGSGGIWSPDGRRVAYQRRESGRFQIYEVLANGAGRPEPLVRSDAVFNTPLAWSPDGRRFVYNQNDETTGWDLWVLPVDGERKPVPYLRTPFNEVSAAISPDGHWLAYNSDETGTSEVYVRSFPEPGEKYRISTSGATAGQWSKDGREMLLFTSSPFYVSGGALQVVGVQTSPTFRAGTPHVLFSPRQDLLGLAPTTDLQRFLAAVPVAGSAPPGITVVMNWPAALAR